MNRIAQKNQPQRRAGYGWIDLVVVIVLVLVIAGLILPALQRAQIPARRTMCLNHLRNLGTAMHNYGTAHHGRLPAYGTFLNNKDGKPVDGRSWIVDLLPYLDQSGIADRWNHATSWDNRTHPFSGLAGEANYDLSQTSIAVLQCRDDPTIEYGDGSISYVVNAGYGDPRFLSLDHNFNIEPHDWNGNGVVNTPDKPDADPADAEIQRDTGVFWAHYQGQSSTQNPSQTLDSIGDGAANTIMLIENTNAGAINGKLTSWANPDPRNSVFLYPIKSTEAGPLSFADPQPSSSLKYPPHINKWTDGPDGAAPFPTSGHPGGINFATCEGGARFLDEDVDPAVFRQLITPNGTKEREGIMRQPDMVDQF